MAASRTVSPAIPLLLGILLVGCASKGFVESVDLFYANQMEESAEAFEGYGRRARGRDQLVYYLNAAVPYQITGDYRTSNERLETAYERLDQLMVRSATGELGRLTISEGSSDFVGEPFEQARIHYFKSLNYVAEGNLESALIEGRRLDTFLKLLRGERKGKDAYSEDAYLRYWTGMMYEADGNLNDAFIAYRNALALYAEQSTFTGISAPGDLPRSVVRTARAIGFEDEARKVLSSHPGAESVMHSDRGSVIVVLHAGRAPKKVSRTMIVPSHEGIPVKIAVPGLEHFRNPAANVRLIVGRGSPSLPPIGDNIERISEQALDDRKRGMIARLVARAVVKEIAAQQARKTGVVAEIVTRVAGAMTEKADTRGWETLPARVYVARLELPPGRHEVSLVLRQVPIAYWEVEVVAGQTVFVKKRYL